MPKTITISVAGQPQEVQADYLNPAALEYWQAWLSAEVRANHNPFVEFAKKVWALPEDLRAAATREFVAGLSFDNAPKLVMLDTVRSLRAVSMLCLLVTGQDLVTQDNCAATLPLLFPFIQRQEFVAASLQEANRLRAEVGKAPLGRSSAGQPPQGG